MIKIIDGLFLRDDTGCSIFNRKYYSAHLRQGDLDGACAVYSLMMYLLILGVVTRRQVEDLGKVLQKPKPVECLFRSLFENRGLVRDGFSYDSLQLIVNRHIGDLVQAHRDNAKKQGQIVSLIQAYLDKGTPVMISVEFSQGAHAMLAVGYEYDESGLFNIFCLDPGFQCPTTSYWNTVICLNEKYRSKFPHKMLTSDKQYNNAVRLGEILVITKKNNGKI